ncbi:ABC transporter substrate-binding protein [Afipia sp. Root123D2]|uniref:ABC transporter substrate-binding protein n=1 Tax=Afipia sp. Root123D2 TaxID=1736436 RepID=UPI0006FB3780|nr:ABC transporter substrate-binding protein [Afipia sp. Root123D2]
MLQKLMQALTATVMLSFTIVSAYAQSGGQPLKVRIGYLLSEVVAPPLLVARDEGLFKAQNLDVELIKFDNGTQMTQALVGNSLDGALAGAAVVSSIAVRGLGVLVNPTYLEYDTNLLYATGESGIKTVQDLKGKQVAFPFGTTAHVLVVNALKKSGLKSSDIKPVNTGYQATTTALIAGAVPAAVITAGFVEAATKKGAVRVTSLKDFYPETAVLGGLVISNAFFDKHKADLPHVGAAIIQAQVKLNEEPIRKKNYDKYFSKMESYDAYTFSFELGKYPTADEWLKSFKEGKVANWALTTAQILKDAGTIDKIGEPSKFLAPDVFEKAAALAKAGK